MSWGLHCRRSAGDKRSKKRFSLGISALTFVTPGGQKPYRSLLRKEPRTKPSEKPLTAELERFIQNAIDRFKEQTTPFPKVW